MLLSLHWSAAAPAANTMKLDLGIGDNIRKTLGIMRSWQYLSAVSAIASSSSVKRFLDASGSCQSKVVFGAEAKLLTAIGRHEAGVVLLAAVRRL